MTGQKLAHVLAYLASVRIPLRGIYVYATGGGELAIETSSQLPTIPHLKMLRWGFIVDPSNIGSYVYRPIR